MKNGSETGQSVFSTSCQFKVNTGSFRTFCSEEKEQPGRMDQPGLRCLGSTHHQRARSPKPPSSCSGAWLFSGFSNPRAHRISRRDKVKNKWRTGDPLAISVTSPSLRRTHHHRENNLRSHENDWREKKKNGMEVSAATCWMRELINLSFQDWRFLFGFLTSFRRWLKIKVLKEPLTTLKTLITQRTLWRLKTLKTSLSHFLFFS